MESADNEGEKVLKWWYHHDRYNNHISSIEFQHTDTSLASPPVTRHDRALINAEPPVPIKALAHFPRVFYQLAGVVPTNHIPIHSGALLQVVEILCQSLDGGGLPGTTRVIVSGDWWSTYGWE